MLTIRPAQMEMFEQLELEKFLRNTRDYIAETWSEASSAYNQDQIDTLIKQAIERCRDIGAEFEQDVLIYIDQMFALGLNFETDARYAWAAEILNDTELDGSSRLERLEEKVASHTPLTVY